MWIKLYPKRKFPIDFNQSGTFIDISIFIVVSCNNLLVNVFGILVMVGTIGKSNHTHPFAYFIAKYPSI